MTLMTSCIAAPEATPAPEAAIETTTESTAETTTGSVASFTVSESQTSGNGIITFGAIFSAGAVAPDQVVTARIRSTALPTQTDIVTTHADGSLRFAVITVDLGDNRGRKSRPLDLYPVPAAETLPLPDAYPTGFSASVTVTSLGRRYTLDLRDLAPVGERWLSGAMVTETRFGGSLRDSEGSEHPHLYGYFDVRHYPENGAVRVDVIVENNWTFTENPHNIDYDLLVQVGNQQYEERALTHYRQARWRKQFWHGARPTAVAMPNYDEWVAIGVVPQYDPRLRIPPRQNAALAAQWRNGTAKNRMPANATLGPGLTHPWMPDTGDRADIGPFPRWTVQYLLTGDIDVREALLGTADRAGSFPIHYRDRKTGLPLSIVDYPQTSLAVPDFGSHPLPPCNSECDVPYKPDAAHMPSLVFVPLLLTGDYYYLEELLFWGTYFNLYRSPRHRHGEKGLIHTHQVRGQAWGLRLLTQSAWIVPDNHPQAPYWQQLLDNNLDYYLQRYIGLNGEAPTAPNALGIVTEGLSWPANRYYITWMDDFLTWATGYAAGLGYDKARPLHEFKSRNVVLRMTDPDYCIVFASLHALNFRDHPNAPPYPDIGRAYRETVAPELRNAGCGSAKMASMLGLRPGQLLRWRPERPRGFPLYMQVALASAVDSGIAGSTTAWQRWEKRVSPHDPNASPEWSIVPRR